MEKISLLKIKPHFEYRVWANDNLKKTFNLKEDSIGEAWLISAFRTKESTIENLNNISLLDFYKNKDNGYFFNFYNLKHDQYPLLSKIIDAKDDLSVQIHPDDQYAKKYHSLGKTECWYILKTKKNNSIVLGHHAKTKQEFKQLVEKGNWEQLLKLVPIKKDDFFYVESTKIHAIRDNTLVFELQQSSDITYRVYDYDRLDRGQKRELHLEHVYNLVQTPDVTLKKNQISNKRNYLVSNQLFNLIKITNKTKKIYHFKDALWLQVSFISGKGKINGTSCKKFDSFLVAYNNPLILEGNLTCLVSFVSKS